MLELVAAKQQDRDLVARLEQFYLYDFSAFTDCTLSPDGVFLAINSFEEIWTDPELFTFILCAKTEPAGLAIVHRLAPEAYDMEQFFVLRKFRRTGAGTAAAQALFQKFPSAWTVRQIPQNKAAQSF
jgi:predicted acetyltransferase